MHQISILGCGWLGLPLAKGLLDEDFIVKGSTTSPAKITTLESAGIHPYVITLSPNEILGNSAEFLNGSDTLIIDIPPKLRGENSELFTDKIQTLVPHIEAACIKNIIFISSTAVYADDNTIVTEDTPERPTTESGKQLLESEKILQLNPNFKTTILRFGGLIGEDRHPVKFLAGKENIENPDGPINLIHQKDCIGIILKILKKEVWGKTLNGVSPFHPTREDYYTKLSAQLGLPAPKFNRENKSVGKTVTSLKIEEVLNYSFKVPLL